MSALDRIADYIERNGGTACDGLNVDKLYGRGDIVYDPKCPNCIVAEVERHRSILGVEYRKGERMHSFETYWPRYAYDPYTDNLKQLDGKRKPELTVDYGQVAEGPFNNLSFYVEQQPDGSYKAQESLTGREETVASRAEAEAFAEEVINGLDYDVVRMLHSRALSSDREWEEFRRKLRAAELKVARRRAGEAWESREAL